MIARTTAILFDFDGPTCDVFSGISAAWIAAELIAVIIRSGTQVPSSVANEQDPLAVLQYSATLGKKVTDVVDSALRAAELDAVRYSAPTPGGHASIRRCAESGRGVGLVSNNSSEAIERYLDMHDLVRYVNVIVGRTHGYPELMKPNPTPIRRALGALGVQPADTLLVGDSKTDVEVCRATHMPCIGYVNKPGKESALSDADALITDMAEIASAVA